MSHLDQDSLPKKIAPVSINEQFDTSFYEPINPMI